MKKELKRETKMAIFTYGCIATIYIVILYIFSMFLFQNVSELGNVFDTKTVALMVFVFVAGVIGMYKATKEIKSDYIRAMAIFVVPTIILLLFKDGISMAVVLMLAFFMISRIYKVTPEGNNILLKIFKLLSVVVVVLAVLLSIGLLVNQVIGNNEDLLRQLAISRILENAISLIIAAMLFMSFATKEIIREVLAKYKPTDKEIGSLVSGTIVLFFVMVVLTSMIQYVYKLSNQENVIYNVVLGLFSLFVLIEIYEEIRIVKMLNTKEKEKID